jgi:hypothetical protein
VEGTMTRIEIASAYVDERLSQRGDLITTWVGGWRAGSFYPALSTASRFHHTNRKEDVSMLFLSYWELNEAMSVEERLQVAQKLTATGLFPPEGVNIIRWDVTPDGWGVTLMEADHAADIDRAFTMWRAAGVGFFKSTKTAPAQPIQEAMPRIGELLKTLSSA